MLACQFVTTRQPSAASLFNSFSSPRCVMAAMTLYSYFMATHLPRNCTKM